MAAWCCRDPTPSEENATIVSIPGRKSGRTGAVMKLKITVHGVAYEVDVEVLDAKDEMHGAASPLPPAPTAAPAAPASAGPVAVAAPVAGPGSAAPPLGGTGGVASPIAGTVLEVKVKVGDKVEQGQTLLVIEAMKMETAIAAPGVGQIKAVLVAAGDAVRENQTLVDFV
ncbi:MAG: biotin/lipoyl-binding protein [Candidatus Krumholzibacteria bacterium]|nr:biotin/lipoyl-binding protein [Candidatus Krumholzibacteria bacterium]